MDVYIDNFGHALGNQRFSVEQSYKRGLTFSSSEILVESGFQYHYVCNGMSTYELAKAAVENLSSSFEKPINDFSHIDGIIYATCLTRNANIGSWETFTESKDVKSLMDFPVSHLQHDFSISNAFVLGVNQMACTSLLGAIRVARAFLHTESDLNNILCLTADRFPEDAIYEQGYNLISDGAAACIVKREPGPFKVVDCHHISNGAMAQASDDETAGFYFNYTYKLLTEMLARNGMSMEDVGWVVPQNTNIKAWQVLSSILNYDFERVLMPTREEIGHCISGDNIINLKTCYDNQQFAQGDYILMPMAGFGLNWSCVMLEKTH